MNAPVIILLVACVFTAVWYFRERNLDEYHLLHGPDDGCPECEGK
jgi:hypothetical protein